MPSNLSKIEEIVKTINCELGALRASDTSEARAVVLALSDVRNALNARRNSMTYKQALRSIRSNHDNAKRQQKSEQ